MSTAALPAGWDPGYSMQLLPALLPAQGTKAGGLQRPFPTQLLGGGRSLILSFLLWVTWFNLWSNL